MLVLYKILTITLFQNIVYLYTVGNVKNKKNCYKNTLHVLSLAAKFLNSMQFQFSFYEVVNF